MPAVAVRRPDGAKKRLPRLNEGARRRTANPHLPCQRLRVAITDRLVEYLPRRINPDRGENDVIIQAGLELSAAAGPFFITQWTRCYLRYGFQQSAVPRALLFLLVSAFLFKYRLHSWAGFLFDVLNYFFSCINDMVMGIEDPLAVRTPRPLTPLRNWETRSSWLNDLVPVSRSISSSWFLHGYSPTDRKTEPGLTWTNLPESPKTKIIHSKPIKHGQSTTSRSTKHTPQS